MLRKLRIIFLRTLQKEGLSLGLEIWSVFVSVNPGDRAVDTPINDPVPL
jgi:hypothetical protein